MTTQPEALRLAEWIESDMSCDGDEKIVAELRRLWAENEAIKAERDEDRRREYGYSQQVVDALTKERDALLEALQDLCDTLGECGMTEKARAAIKQAEKNT